MRKVLTRWLLHIFYYQSDMKMYGEKFGTMDFFHFSNLLSYFCIAIRPSDHVFNKYQFLFFFFVFLQITKDEFDKEFAGDISD